MINEATFRKTAMTLPKALEKPHFDRAGFRVDAPKGKMFCTLAADGQTCNVFLTIEEQEMLTASEPEIFSKLPNKWGDKGATMITLSACDAVTLRSALVMSWRHAAPEKLHDLLTL